MADKLMYILHYNTQSYPFHRLKLVVEKFGHPTKEQTNQISLEVSKVFEPTNKKTVS